MGEIYIPIIAFEMALVYMLVYTGAIFTKKTGGNMQ